jgi:TolA-binding protein
MEADIEAFRKEVSSMRYLIPSLPFPDPSPSEIEDMAQKSPSQASIVLKETRKKYTLIASNYLNAEIVRIGQSIESSPTNDDNYNKRRTILIALQQAAKMNTSISGLFPKGPPDKHLPVNNASTKAFEFCDNSFSYLAKLLFKNLPPELKASLIGGSSSSDSKKEDVTVATLTPIPEETSSQAIKVKKQQEDANIPQIKSQWQIIGKYFRWIIYIFIVIALAGLAIHLLKGLSGLSRLTKQTLKAEDKDAQIYLEENSSKDFKNAMKHFKANQYEKAIEGFNSLNTKEKNVAHNAAFFRILSEIGLAQTDRALQGIKAEGYKTFSLEELYRLAHSFEDTGDLENSKKMYLKVQQRDNTFRNVAQRINAIEQSIQQKAKS